MGWSGGDGGGEAEALGLCDLFQGGLQLLLFFLDGGEHRPADPESEGVKGTEDEGHRQRHRQLAAARNGPQEDHHFEHGDEHDDGA